MSESADYTPAPHWGGYDFKSARRAYVHHVDRSYKDAVEKSVDPNTLIPDCLSTNCESPLVIACDVTGSMGEWPATIFSKLPYLEHEGQEYLGEDMEISFAAVGDAYSDNYPLQIQDFAKKADLKSALEKLIHEKGGGGSSEESYDLAASYYAHNCEMPKAIRKPIFIFIGDEGVYQTLNEDHTNRWARVTSSEKINPTALFESLKKKFNVYVIRKPYNCSGNNPSPAETRIKDQWCKLLGDDHVVSLPDPARVVDVIFGILAQEVGRVPYFEKELTDRQNKDTDGKKKIDIVLKSLRTIHKPTMKKLPPVDRAKSITRGLKPSGAKSISLLDDEE